MVALSSTTAAAVSSQEVSIPRMRIVSWGLDLAQFNYHLPESSIAQEPLEDRAGSRMLVLYRGESRWEDRLFRELPQFLGAGDCLVLNDSKVLPSRLLGRRAGKFSGQVEILLLQPLSEDAKTWTALVHPGRKMRTGERVRFGDVEAEIIGRGEYGERTVRFHLDGDIHEVLERIGHMPLPPYIKRNDRADDRERYQTVRGEKLHAERFHLTKENAEKIRAAKRVVCAGTTSVRAVESLYLGKSG